MSIRRRLFAVLPQRLLSRLLGALARWRAGPLTALAIRRFARRYGVRLDEAAESDPSRYPNFAAFFARALRPGARTWPDDPCTVASPVDGILTAAGRIESGTLIQAKGLTYPVASLLGNELAPAYEGGSFATIYLRPQDYHRIHCPLSARLLSAQRCRGRLWPARPWALAEIPSLFLRNERLGLHFETDGSRFSLVMVGAMFVGGIETTATGLVGRGRYAPERWNFATAPRPFARGEEIGAFQFGSTVILLFAPGLISFAAGLEAGAEIAVGAPLGRMVGSRT